MNLQFRTIHLDSLIMGLINTRRTALSHSTKESAASRPTGGLAPEGPRERKNLANKANREGI